MPILDFVYLSSFDNLPPDFDWPGVGPELKFGFYEPIPSLETNCDIGLLASEATAVVSLPFFDLSLYYWGSKYS